MESLSPLPYDLNLKENTIVPRDYFTILQDKKLSRFGDSVVNFVYNFVVYRAFNILGGVKVSDYCLSEACKNSVLRKFAGTKKKKGDLADIIEAFLGFVVLRNEKELSYIIDKMTLFLKSKYQFETNISPEICIEMFIFIVNDMCEKHSIKD